MYLLSQGNVNANIKDGHGYTLLHRACININHLPLEIFKFLIETMGCDVNAQSTYNYIPLHHALRFFNPNDGGEITVLMYLLGHEAVNGNTKSRNGYTLLHIACENINYLPLEIFKVLIETKGCDINAQNTDDDTPLHYALPSFNTNNGIIALTYLLTKTNVNVNIKGHNGDTLLHFACKNINYLRLDVFKLLIETLGYDVNAQNTRNDTPLHYTLRFFNPNDGGDITVLTYLFTRKGIDPNIKGQYGHTLLHSACIKINNLPIDVFKFLIETMGFDINIRDDYGAIPLHCAFHGFDPNNDSNIIVLAYLINQNNFNVNIKDQEGCTFLHWACTWDTSDLNNVPDSEDDWNDLEAKLDTVLSHIAEIIAERCVEQVFDESSS